MSTKSGQAHSALVIKGVLVWGLIILTFIFALASPALLGNAIASATRGDVGSAVMAFYGLGFALLLYGWVRNLSKEDKLTAEEVAYNEWLIFPPYSKGPMLAAGVGATAYLENMIRKGVLVPPVAFDLCGMLTSRMMR